ncbi:hypothetical protein ONE63_011293 [Megalurothrips usitatus]|uniref:Uncharacterized protein n=1 Tax=Megalurothrips usitatus TaxID=439358 RepID=A0AAV7X238_9NEOP|nr:hypothetical protein ONE63_011293 [Megalurothrips usitatus]
MQTRKKRRTFNARYYPLGVPPLDPLFVEQLVLVSPDLATCELNKFDVSGLKDVVCETASFLTTGPRTFNLTFDLLVPQFGLSGTYKMQQGFLGHTKSNDGAFTFNMAQYLVNFVLGGTVHLRAHREK